MQDDYSQYELLARYLDPQFGNIYEYNMKPGQVTGFDFQDWTDELHKAVRDYLVFELPMDVALSLGKRRNEEDEFAFPKTSETWVDELMLKLQPWEVALEIRNAAIILVPTLRQLIGHLDDWPSEDERLDAETWLEAYGLTVDWRALMAAANHHELTTITMPSGRVRQPYPDDLVQRLTPAELLFAWEYVIGPSPTDLTDDEWQLLMPHFGPMNSRWGERTRSADELDAKRRTLNAIRFKNAHPMPWSHLPSRYGAWQTTYQTYHHYRVDGLLARLRDGLQDNPDAAQLVAWLNTVIADAPHGWVMAVASTPIEPVAPGRRGPAAVTTIKE